MKIGIVSDSHGKASRLKAALDIFAARGVESIVHCGDIGSAECVEVLGAADVATYAIAGNMDHNIDQLANLAEKCGVNFAWEVIEVPIGNDKFLVATHGHDEDILGELVAEQQFPYVCHGHTHRIRDERIGNVRLINPGPLHHARRHTVAILETDSDTLEHIEVPD